MIEENHITSDTQVDQIIGLVTSGNLGTISISGSTTQSFTYPTNIADSCLYEGRFRVHSVNVWTPITASSYTTSSTSITAPQVQVFVKIQANIATITVANGSSSSQVLDFEIVLIAKTDQNALSTQDLISQVSFDSSKNYLKILDQNIIMQNLAAATAVSPFSTRTTTDIPQPSGLILMCKAWVEYNGAISLSGSYMGDLLGIPVATFASIVASKMSIDSFNIFGSIASPAVTIKVHYRIYYDN